MRIAIFGGAFDPPTYGHVLGITQILYSGQADAVWVIPSGDRADKKSIVSGELRLEMMRRLVRAEFAQFPQVEVKDFQVRGLTADWSTISLIEFLYALHPEHDYFLVIGSDLLGQVKGWIRASELLEKYSFLVIARGHATQQSSIVEYDGGIKNFIWIHSPPELASDLSSSFARELIVKQQCLSGVVPIAVQEFIVANGLYLSAGREKELS